MNEEEKEEIELDIEAKYVDKTEKEFLSRVTYAECIYILTPENKYCDKIKELSVLKICEIIKNLQKENEELNKENEHLHREINRIIKLKIENEKIVDTQFIYKQKIEDKIEELNQYYKKEIYPSLYQWGDKTITEHYDEMIGLLQELLGDK